VEHEVHKDAQNRSRTLFEHFSLVDRLVVLQGASLYRVALGSRKWRLYLFYISCRRRSV